MSISKGVSAVSAYAATQQILQRRRSFEDDL